MNDEGRRSIGAGLDTDHEEREGGQAPMAEAEKEEDEDPDEDRDHDPTGKRRANPGEINQPRGASCRQASVHVLVPGGDSTDLEDHLREQKTAGDREPDE